MFRNLFFISIIVSVALHLGTVLMLHLKEKQTPEKKEFIEVSFESPESLAEKQIKRQIVQQNEKPLNDEKPEDSKYLGQHNQKVVKETRAAKSGEFTNRADRVDSEAIDKQQGKPKSSKVGKGLNIKDNSLNGMPIMQALRPSFEWDKVENKDGQRRQTASKTDDYLKDVEISAQTLLSTREFLYYSYYNRIRAQLKQYWEPRIKEKMKKIFSQGRQIASDEDRITKIIITLDKGGILVKVQVIGESGIRDLDDAAVEAFKQAAPFPNPPKGIIDPEGLIKIRWDFILEA